MPLRCDASAGRPTANLRSQDNKASLAGERRGWVDRIGSILQARRTMLDRMEGTNIQPRLASSLLVPCRLFRSLPDAASTPGATNPLGRLGHRRIVVGGLSCHGWPRPRLGTGYRLSAAELLLQFGLEQLGASDVSRLPGASFIWDLFNRIRFLPSKPPLRDWSSCSLGRLWGKRFPAGNRARLSKWFLDILSRPVAFFSLPNRALGRESLGYLPQRRLGCGLQGAR